MKKDIKIPTMGESISEATVGTILKSSGSQVAMDDEILELETDKVNQVLYAPQAGILTLSVNVDDTVKIGQVIGFVDADGAPAASEPAPKPEPVSKADPEPKNEAAEKPKPETKEQEPSEPQHEARLTKEAYIKQIAQPALTSLKKPKPLTPKVKESESKSAPSEPVDAGGRETRRRMTKIRRIIAQRLVESQQTTAMLTTFNEIDLTVVMGLRAKYKDYFAKEYDTKLGFMSFFVKATVSALMAFPEVNSYISGDDIVHRNYYDIGIAVGTERGLIVPVIRDCDHLSFAEIEKTIENYAQKARDGTISVDDLQGGGFTITNGGTYGSLLSTPILNPPQSGILGMHKIEKRAVVIEDEIVIRPMMYVAMSYDHRVIDGKEAVSFLVHIKNHLEDPSRLLLGV